MVASVPFLGVATGSPAPHCTPHLTTSRVSHGAGFSHLLIFHSFIHIYFIINKTKTKTLLSQGKIYRGLFYCSWCLAHFSLSAHCPKICLLPSAEDHLFNCLPPVTPHTSRSLLNLTAYKHFNQPGYTWDRSNSYGKGNISV